MANFNYDEEGDIFTIDISSKKAYLSLEVSPDLIVDLAANHQLTGIELLNASEVLSKLFGINIKKSELHKIHCAINQDAIENNEGLYATFKLGEKTAKVLIPTNYESPIVSG
ncbi:MAG: DUF2283 domain-containing protein [Candidatus Micrarchaeota archaeon]